MNKMAVFVDIGDLYVKVNRGRKMNYGALLDYIRDLGNMGIVRAYGYKSTKKFDKFAAKLQKIGYETIYDETIGCVGLRQSVRIAMDALSMIDDYDILVLVTSDPSIAPLAEAIRAMGKQVIFVGVNLPPLFAGKADAALELPREVLM